MPDFLLLSLQAGFSLLAGYAAARPKAERAGEWPAFDLQGHRGARGLLPENTLPAMQRALELGVTTLEMDVVITKDGHVVLSHEPWFSAEICSLPSGEPVPPEAERSYRLYEMTYAEVTRFDCGRRGHPRFPRQEKRPAVKPLLRDVIEAAEAYTDAHGLPPVWYNIETKSTPAGDGVYHPDPETFTRLLSDVVAAAGVKARAVLQSFDVRTLRAARRLDPAWALALLVAADGGPGLAERLDDLGFTPALYSPDHRLVDAALVAEAHRRGMRVVPWTVNTVEEMARLRDLGVDGLITDYPDLGVQLLPPRSFSL